MHKIKIGNTRERETCSTQNMEEYEILKSEVRSALAKMNRNKTARPDYEINAINRKRFPRRQNYEDNK